MKTNWYKKAQEAKFQFQVGQELTYNYPKVAYKGTCVVQQVNEDGSIDVLDHSGRMMPHFNPYSFDPVKMFKEML